MHGVLFLYCAIMATSALAVVLGIRLMPPRADARRVEWDEPV